MAKKVTHQTTTAEHLVKFAKDNGLTYTKFGELLGVSPQAVGHWVNIDKAPKWTRVAVEGLQRQARRPKSSLLIFKSDGAISAERMDIIKSLGLELVGSIEA